MMKNIKIKEKSEELKSLFKKTNNPKIQMLYLLKTKPNLPKKTIVEILSVEKSAFYKWQDKYTEGGIEYLLEDGRKNNGKKGIITFEVKEAIKKELSNPKSSFTAYAQIQIWLEKKFEIKMNYSALYKFLRRNLKTKLNVARPCHIKKDKKKQKIQK